MKKGLVIRTTGSWYKVLSDSAVVECRLRGSYRLRGSKQTNPVAVGDYVLFSTQDDGTGLIHDIAERKNHIIRKATKLSKQTHVIAANIDLLCIIATLDFPRTSTGFIDRLLATAEAYHIDAALVFNKADRCTTPEQRAVLGELAARYTRIGYPFFETSALTGQGVATLTAAIKGKVVLFSGHSGVGKSALLNTIDPSLDQKVGTVSEWSQKGKHTTTFAEIFPLQHLEGTYLIDTPGIKEFGLVDFKKEELSHFFPEMRERLHHCHYSNCTHRHEPQCAIKEAVAAGEIDAERYQNYLNIIESLDEVG